MLVSSVILVITVLVLVDALRNIISKGTTKRKRIISAIILIALLAVFAFIAYSFHEIDMGFRP